MVELTFKQKITELIDGLKSVCATYGLGNDGNEFKIITQVFLYKFLHDKFAFAIKQFDAKFNEKWEEQIEQMSEEEFDLLTMSLNANIAVLKPAHFIRTLYQQQNQPGFANLFDDTLYDIALHNNDIFAVQTASGAKIELFERLSHYIIDQNSRDDFCRAIINKLVDVSFEEIFSQKFDFYATIFEYLIKDYNSNSGGKYAEYYTPHAVARIMADIIVPQDQRGNIRNVSCYDPSAGSGTLLMNIAHAIGEDKCTIFTQDISQKSSHLLRLNLILNNLVLSIPNVVKGDTLLNPAHREKSDNSLKQFDYIVSNPPFKMDFSDIRDQLDTAENKTRFFAGIPTIPQKKKEGMEIYLLFLQHIIYSLKENGKAAVVVPTGFITAQSGIAKKVRQKLVDDKMLAGVISMPSNIFATTDTNVSILLIDLTNKDNMVLIDASQLGEKIKNGKNKKTVLSADEEKYIVEVFSCKQKVENFSVVVSYDDIIEKNYSLSAGQYFDVKIDFVEMQAVEFEEKIAKFNENLTALFKESEQLEVEIREILTNVQLGKSE